MSDYIYLIHPLRHSFFDSPTLLENQVMEAHYAYLQKGMAMGMVLLAGPCLDETFEVVVIRAEDDESAKKFMFKDPSVSSNVMVAELHPMKIALMNPV